MEAEEKPSHNDESPIGKKFDLFQKIVLGVIAIASAVAALGYNDTINKLEAQGKKLENTATDVETVLKQKTFQNELKLKMYAEVKEAVEKKNPDLQAAVSLILNTMLADDSVFRTQLQGVLLGSPTTDTTVKKQIINTQKEESVFTSSLQNSLKRAKEESDGTRGVIDVFYTQDVPASKQPASTLVDDLKRMPEFQGYHINFKMLPKSVNARSGYLITTNQIRYEADELELATKLQSVLNKKVDLQDFELRGVRNKTPNYVSIFVRNVE